MGCGCAMELGKQILKNLYASVLEKGIILLGQFLTAFIVIRLLPREQYAFVGISLGMFTFVSFFNVALESILYRDHKKFSRKISFYLRHFFYFSLFKCLLFIVVAIALAIWGYWYYQQLDFIYALGSILVIFSTDAIVAPFVVLASSSLKHFVVTKMSFIRNLLNLISLLGLYFSPSLKFLLVRDIFISTVFLLLWFIFAVKVFDLNLNLLFKPRLYWSLYKRSIFGYSLWVHFIGVVTGFIYKADTFFLSLYSGMVTVGNYAVALNGANVANLLPSILGQQNSVALSNSSDTTKRYETTCIFLRASIYIGVITFLIFFLFGRFYLKLITGDSDVTQMNFYLLCIVGGLVIVKSVASPLVSYINIYGDVKGLFVRVNIPILTVSAISYYSTASIWGAQGVALANIFNSLFWCALVLVEIRRYDFDFGEVFKIKKDYQLLRNIIKGESNAL